MATAKNTETTETVIPLGTTNILREWRFALEARPDLAQHIINVSQNHIIIRQGTFGLHSEPRHAFLVLSGIVAERVRVPNGDRERGYTIRTIEKGGIAFLQGHSPSNKSLPATCDILVKSDAKLVPINTDILDALPSLKARISASGIEASVALTSQLSRYLREGTERLAEAAHLHTVLQRDIDRRDRTIRELREQIAGLEADKLHLLECAQNLQAVFHAGILDEEDQAMPEIEEEDIEVFVDSIPPPPMDEEVFEELPDEDVEELDSRDAEPEITVHSSPEPVRRSSVRATSDASELMDAEEADGGTSPGLAPPSDPPPARSYEDVSTRETMLGPDPESTGDRKTAIGIPEPSFGLQETETGPRSGLVVRSGDLSEDH